MTEEKAAAAAAAHQIGVLHARGSTLQVTNTTPYLPSNLSYCQRAMRPAELVITKDGRALGCPPQGSLRLTSLPCLDGRRSSERTDLILGFLGEVAQVARNL